MKRILALLTAVLIFAAVFTLPSFAAEEQNTPKPEYESFDELNGKTISMLTGAPFENLISSKVPDLKEFSYYSNVSEMVMGLKTKKTDAGLLNTMIVDMFTNKDPELAMFPEPLKEAEFGIGFSKSYEDIDLWQSAFDSIDPKDIDAIWDKWTGADDSAKIMPEVDWEGKNGVVRVAIGDSMQPACYVGSDGQMLGLEAEIILLMAKQIDYKVEFLPMDFSSLIACVESGKADLCAGSLIITDERKKALDFVAYYDTAFVFIVRSEKGASNEYNIFGDFTDKFKDALVTDGRYKLIISGLGTTIIISVVSGIIGLLLAFGMEALKRKNKKPINIFLSVYCRLVAGLPVVVILMILYYVVFASSELPGTFVAIVGFSIIFAPKAYALITNAVDAIDKGQLEGALALGYTEKKAYRRIILPQARKIYFPLLKTQFALLVKETSIVGYIAVVDLTRSGDIIRGYTLEAFFPLLIVAIIYFLLTWLITVVIDVGNAIVTGNRRRKVS